MDVDKKNLLSPCGFDCAFFKVLDVDCDGYLSRAEYEAGFDRLDYGKEGVLCKWKFLMACRPGFLFDVLSHVGADRITSKEYDAGYYFIGADNILTKEEWDGGWLLVDLDLDGFISRSKLRGAYLHPLKLIMEF